MTIYRLLDGASGRPGVGSSGTTPPTGSTAYAGPWLDATVFSVTQGGMWLNAYWKWVPTGGDTVARKFSLNAYTGAGAGVNAGSNYTVTSGVLTAGTFNRIPLATPQPLPIGFLLQAATGWTAVNGFTNTTHQFGSTNPYAAGIVNGPLTGWSDTGGSLPAPQYGAVQSPFSTGGSDPTLVVPTTNDLSDIFWTDVEVSDTGPAGYTGPYDAWPGVPAGALPNSSVVNDAAQFYSVGMRFNIISIPGFKTQCIGFKFYSPSGVTALPGTAHVWSVPGGGTGTPSIIGGTASPSWSGAAGSGWVTCSVTAFDLPVASYAVSAWNNANAVAVSYNSKDIGTDYFRSGFGKNGWTFGPLQVPQLGSAGSAWNYNGVAAGTPPFSDGTTVSAQPVFGQSTSQAGPDPNPFLNAPVATPTAGSTQNYWVTPIVQIVATGSSQTVFPVELDDAGVMNPSTVPASEAQLGGDYVRLI